jgi:hypothetical protein
VPVDTFVMLPHTNVSFGDVNGAPAAEEIRPEAADTAEVRKLFPSTALAIEQLYLFASKSTTLWIMLITSARSGGFGELSAEAPSTITNSMPPKAKDAQSSV